MAIRAFVSYSRKDQGLVQTLLADLEQAHVTVWHDKELHGGDKWWQRILKEIRESDVFVFALSANSLASKPCRTELQYARALGLPVLPVQIGPVDSLRTAPVADLQLVDYRQRTAASGMALFSALEEAAARRAELPDPLPPAPAVPFAYLLRLGAAIEAEELTPGQQGELIHELRDCLETEDEPTVREDARELLRALRRRRDVTFRNVAEIDALLADSPIPQAAPARPSAGEVAGGARAAATGPAAGLAVGQPPPSRAGAPYPAAGAGGPAVPAAFPPQSGTADGGWWPSAPSTYGPGTTPPPAPPGFAPSPRPAGPRRRPLVLGGVAAVVILLGVGAFLLFGRGGGEPPPVSTDPTATTTVPTSPGPTSPAGPEQTLLSVLPVGFAAEECSSIPLAGDGDVAAVECGALPAPGPAVTAFHLYPAGTVDSVFLEDMTEFGVREFSAEEQCPSPGYGYGYFNGVTMGRLACWVDGQGAHLLWTSDEFDTEGFVTTPGGGLQELAGLYDWWRDPRNGQFVR